MGLSDTLAGSSLRFSVGRFTTEAEVVRAAATVVGAVNRLRFVAKSAPAWCSGSGF
jgi:cysteine desulfurase